MKKLLGIGILGLSALSLTSCGEKEYITTVGGNNDLVVGMECAYAPFNWTEETSSDTNYEIANVDGKYCDGYDVQVAKLLAEELDMKLVIKQIEWTPMITNLTNDNIDVIIAGMSPTEKRKLSVDFAESYYTATYVAIVDSGSSLTDNTTISSLNGLKGIAQVSTGYDEAVALVENVEHLPAVDSVSLAVAAVKSGSADFTITELPVATQIVDADTSLKIINFTDTFAVAEEYTVVSPAVRKEDTALKEAINTFLASFTDAERTTLMNEALASAPSAE